MNWIQYTDTRFPRATVWCLSKDLQAGATDGTYNFVDTEFEQNDVGDGTDIIVMDSGKLLFYSKENHVAYDFGSGGGGGGDEPPAGYVTVAPKQSVTVTSEVEEGEIQLAEGVDVSDLLDEHNEVIEGLLVTVDGHSLEYVNSEDDGASYYYEDTETGNLYYISSTMPPSGAKIVLGVNDGTYSSVPGTYTVSIYAPESEGE